LVSRCAGRPSAKKKVAKTNASILNASKHSSLAPN
jgi:hypothetical protein